MTVFFFFSLLKDRWGKSKGSSKWEKNKVGDVVGKVGRKMEGRQSVKGKDGREGEFQGVIGHLLCPGKAAPAKGRGRYVPRGPG